MTYCNYRATISGKRTPLHIKWSGIKDRCYNPNCVEFHRYGGRGIKVCDRWLESFEAFVDFAKSHGWKEGLSIDRIDNDGDYEPANVQFIPLSENAGKREITDAIRKASRKTGKALIAKYGHLHLGPKALSKKVTCVETGETWPSSRQANVDVRGCVRSAIRKNRGRLFGKTYKYIT